jgi:hypothetical protein
MRRRDLMATAVGLSWPLNAARAVSAPTVLELFTSQGCSSCPPADALLGQLSEEPDIIGLAWHVDYWNGLGWADPFARNAWTNRQRAYAARLGAEVFTPAMVVDGATMVVGSDRSAVRRAIGAMRHPMLPVALRRAKSGVTAEIGAVAAPAMALWAVYDPEHTTQVGAGENSGRRLIEYRVVRSAQDLGSVEARFDLPAVPANQGAVLLLQDASWRVIGAADLPPISNAAARSGAAEFRQGAPPPA